KEELRKKIASLESANDQIYTELSHVDELMRLLGFQDGLETVKATAQSLYEERDPDFVE
nr:hypothetical protein [Chlamydiota bacterium]